jgi:hypothetical protein
MNRFTEEQLVQILKNGYCSVSGSLPKLKKAGRVNSHKIEIDGYLFDSKSEALIYSEYKIDPDVEILELQPRFILLTPFKRKNKSYRGITYKADFVISVGGDNWVVEVKSKGTLKANSKNYPMRRKLFLNKFPDLNFREIIFDGKQRTEIDY